MGFDRAYIKEISKEKLRYQGSGSAIGVGFLMALLGGETLGNTVRINFSANGASIRFPANGASIGLPGNGSANGDASPVVLIMIPLIVLLVAGLVLYTLLLGNVIANGGRGWFLRYSRGERIPVGEMFASFRIYKPVLCVTALRTLYCFLWGLFTCGIGSVVMGYAYSMADYIIYENPNLTASQALRLSRVMTDGEKWNLFVFELSYIGWELLSGLTCGILGIVYVTPYMYTAHAGVYDELKDQGIRQNRFTWADFGQYYPAPGY